MKNRYSRNRIYLNEEEQAIVKETPILLAGCGIGSVIAECALRFGFENLTIIDGDQVEQTNLNRQNFTEGDVTLKKTEAIQRRLKEINSDAVIKVYDCFLTEDNLEEFILEHKIAINALDFSSDVPLKFDKICNDKNIPVLHPYNIGWGGLVTVVSSGGSDLETIARPNRKFSEIDFVEYALGHLEFLGNPQSWATEILKRYLAEEGNIPPPQLAIGSWTVAAMCTTILFDIATEAQIKKFPAFYFSSIKSS